MPSSPQMRISFQNHIWFKYFLCTEMYNTLMETYAEDLFLREEQIHKNITTLKWLKSLIYITNEVSIAQSGKWYRKLDQPVIIFRIVSTGLHLSSRFRCWSFSHASKEGKPEMWQQWHNINKWEVWLNIPAFFTEPD